MIRLCLVDDQHLVRRGIRALLGLLEDIEVVAEAADGDAAVAAIVETAPDVVLLDLRMPGRDGLGVLAELRARGSLPPTIILTTFDEDQLVLDALRAGARGFLLKDVSLERLSAAIRAVAAGGTAIQPGLTERLLESGGRGGWDAGSLAPPEPLTERETEVLRLVVGGLSNREIAGALAVAEGTVKNHLSTILAKLGVRDRTRAVLKALAERLV
ncbi:MAG TPA: response regulator transcription factor [Thermoanaerobaculia bacterium]|nr:response regulator transcription factor [Thermoanaerobaculia bacterium]